MFQQSQQQVFGADVLVPKSVRFVFGAHKNRFRIGIERKVYGRGDMLPMVQDDD